MTSILTKNQKQKFTKMIDYEGKACQMTVTLRYDDECNNGHNTFSITGMIEQLGVRKMDSTICAGCIHEEIEKYFPKLKHLIKWHLCSSDKPMYYLENTLYHASEKDFTAARHTAIWEDATDEQLSLPSEELKKLLIARLPELMANFKKDIEALGFIY